MTLLNLFRSEIQLSIKLSYLLQIFMRFLTIVFLSAHILIELWYVKAIFFWKQEPENTILLI